MSPGNGGDNLMLDFFRQEAESHGGALAKGLESVETDPNWEALLRAARSVRSAAVLVGLSPVADMCTEAEKALSAAADLGELDEETRKALSDAAGLLVDLSQLDMEEMPGQVDAGGPIFERMRKRIASAAGGRDGEAFEGVSGENEDLSVEDAGQGLEAEEFRIDGAPLSDLADASMLELFGIEAETQARTLESGLVKLESDASAGNLEVLMRAAHSIKGAARIVGLDQAVVLAHAMEDMLEAARQGEQKLSSKAIDLLLSGNDVFLALASVNTEDIPDTLHGQAGRIKALAGELRAAMAGEGHEEPKDLPADKVQGTDTKKKVREKRSDSFIRVSSESLNRLMGLAGECLVEARSLEGFLDEMSFIRSVQSETASRLEEARRLTASEGVDYKVREALAEAGERLRKAASRTASHMEGFDSFSRRLEQHADRLYNEVIASHMRPFSDGLHGFARMVRDVAKKLSKKVDLRILGESTRVDRDILEKLEAPLTHLLRNAVDHGLETPEERASAGKQETGNLTLEARHRSGLLTIDVRDDGRGVDPEAIRKKIVERSMASEDMVREMSVSELMDFLFLPGFSTAGVVSEISGRGVGLDVVHSMVQEVGGRVRADSVPGKGTVFHLQLPLTLSVVRTLVVDVGGEPLAMPLTRLERIVKIAADELQFSQGCRYAVIEGANVGLVHARQVLGLGTPAPDGESLSIVLVSDRMGRYGLIVDGFLGERDLVVKVLDARLGKVAGVSAGAVLEDGSPVLIADLDDLVRAMQKLIEQGKLYRAASGEKEIQPVKRVLVVDDSLTVREVERRLLEGRGFEVAVAVDGMDGWNTLRGSRFDLVVTDVDMPRLDGIGLTERIKADETLSHTPVMIVSYKDREEDRLRGMEAGADHYLAKSSFHDESLIEAVEDLIGEP